ncbi:uncharacterized protein PG986_004623 [Apiospora aurea]|uniref:Uncharacterized protein n=1 Tax=Apiospora aurea TaxID=335848 RepID=A0ABR1QPQ1_9PEZI
MARCPNLRPGTSCGGRGFDDALIKVLGVAALTKDDLIRSANRLCSDCDRATPDSPAATESEPEKVSERAANIKSNYLKHTVYAGVLKQARSGDGCKPNTGGSFYVYLRDSTRQ